MKKLRISSALLLISFVWAGTALQAQKLEKAVIVNLGEWQYQQNNANYEANKCFWNTLNDVNLDGVTYEAKNTDNPTEAEQPFLLDWGKNVTTLSIKTSDAFAGINRDSKDALPADKQPYSFSALPGLEFHRAPLQGAFFLSDDMDDEGAVLISGFDQGYTYNLYAFCTGSRGEEAGVNIETEVTATGANTASGAQDANQNHTELIPLLNIIPTADGTIELRAKAGANNATALHYAYFSTIIIETGEERSAVANVYTDNCVSVIGTQIIIKQDLSRLNVYDLSGKCVMSQMGVNAHSLVDFASLSGGVYMLRAENEAGQLQTIKFVK